MTDENQEIPDEVPSEMFDFNRWTDITENTLDRFVDVSHVESAYGEPVTHGDHLIIPTAEVVSVMGFGFGGGSGYDNKPDHGPDYGGGGGGGGGGNAFSRPVAVVVASPEGVRVEPVVDVTKLGLAALTAFGFMAATFLRMGSYRRAMRQLKKLRG